MAHAKRATLKACRGIGGRRGIRGDASQVAPLSPLEKTLSQAKLESSYNAKKVDSSMDCHATATALARNDDKNTTILKQSAKDSRIFDTNADRRQDFNLNTASEKVDSRSETKTLNNSAKDSRICDEKSGLSSDWQGSYLSGNDRRQSRRIADLSRKAESTNQVKFTQNPTPPLISSIAHFYAQITQGQICQELAQHTLRVVQILEQIDAATSR